MITLNPFTSGFDNIVGKERAMGLDWDNLVELLSEHRITEHKNEWGAVFGRFVDVERAAPAVLKRGTVDEVILHNTVGRLSENLLEVHAICLDYDSGSTISGVREQLQGIAHLGYTSFSHLKDGATEKFRIIIPLADPCPKHEWLLRRDDLVALFPGVDASCVACARIFYLPACPQERKCLAQTWSESGEPIDWRTLATRPIVTPTEPRLRPVSTTGTGKVAFETFDAAAFMTEKGLMRRRISAAKYEVICPNHNEHTNAATEGTVLYQDGSGWPVFHCGHAHCNPDSNKLIYRLLGEQYGKGFMIPYCERELAPTHHDTMTQYITNWKKKST